MVTHSGPNAMALRTHSFQLASVSLSMPAIRSMLICWKPAARETS